MVVWFAKALLLVLAWLAGLWLWMALRRNRWR